MKRLSYICLVLLASCATTQQLSIQEDKLLLTRKYVGNFMEYRQHIPEKLGEPNLIWIKTSLDSTYGKFSAYGQKCDFMVGDRLYIKDLIFRQKSIGYWLYQIESDDNKAYYRLSDFQHDRQDWYRIGSKHPLYLLQKKLYHFRKYYSTKKSGLLTINNSTAVKHLPVHVI